MGSFRVTKSCTNGVWAIHGIGDLVNCNTQKIAPEEVLSQDTYYWIVNLVHGSDGSGIVQDTRLVTKKYERVDALLEQWEDLIESGEYSVNVLAVAITETDTYTA